MNEQYGDPTDESTVATGESQGIDEALEGTEELTDLGDGGVRLPN